MGMSIGVMMIGKSKLISNKCKATRMFLFNYFAVTTSSANDFNGDAF